MSNRVSADSSQTHSTKNTIALLIFTLDGQLYSLPVNQVVRIIEMVTIIQVNNVSADIKGVINFHGKAVPIMDMRRRLGFEERPYGAHTPIMLIDTPTTTELAEDGRLLGLVVDEVQQVVYVPVDDVKYTTTELPTGVGRLLTHHAAYLSGMTIVDEKMVILLDVLALLQPDDYDTINQDM